MTFRCCFMAKQFILLVLRICLTTRRIKRLCKKSLISEMGCDRYPPYICTLYANFGTSLYILAFYVITILTSTLDKFKYHKFTYSRTKIFRWYFEKQWWKMDNLLSVTIIIHKCPCTLPYRNLRYLNFINSRRKCNFPTQTLQQGAVF